MKAMRITYGFVIALIAMLFASCEHKDLCYHHPHPARVRINVDWSHFDVAQPTGMSVSVYDEITGDLCVNTLSNTLSHVYVSLDPARYHSIVFNQSPSEYGTVEFCDMDNYFKAKVLTSKYVSRWYVSRGGESREVGDAPEWIGADRVESFEVTKEMSGDRVQQETVRSASDDYVVAEHQPRNIIHTLNVKVNLSNVKYLRSARASLDGLAEGYLFSSGQPLETSVVQLLESWKLTSQDNPIEDYSKPVDGYLSAQITFFGLPSGHGATPAENLFTLSMLLIDNKTQIDVPFEAGHLIKPDPEKENHWNLELTVADPLPEVGPEGGTGAGFSATVDDWEEGEDITVGI